MHTTIRHHVPLPFLPSLLCLLICLSGCVSYTSDQQIVQQRVPSETPLIEILPGQTSTNWLLEKLGEPDAVRPGRGHETVWQYENIHHQATTLRAFPLLGLHAEEQQVTTFNFAVEHDVIVRYWKEML